MPTTKPQTDEKMGSGVSSSTSHYQVFGERVGFRWLQGNNYVYEVKGVNGKVFTIDLDTGNIIKKSTEQPAGGDGKFAPLSGQDSPVPGPPPLNAPLGTER